MLLLRQIAILVWKNILIALYRRPITTTLRALILPIAFGWFLSFAKNFFIPPATYGIGSLNPIRSLEDALPLIGDRSHLVFVNNNFTGGQIERIINEVGDQAKAAGKNVTVLEKEEDLLIVCRNSLRGASTCIAGVVFHSSPTEPEGAGLSYNYTLRFDGALGPPKINVYSTQNDADIFVLPLQRAVDSAIARVNGTGAVQSLPVADELPYTSLSGPEREKRIRTRYMIALINVIGVAFFVGICGIQYQQVGAQATEREIKMSQLLEVMMPNRRRYEPQIARLASYHLAFSIIYLPGWIALAVILQKGVFADTSIGLIIVFHLLSGLSLASFSLFAASFFRKAQLSGITTIMVSLLLAIIAQVYSKTRSGVVIICSLLFPSMNYTYFIVYMARFQQENIPTDLLQDPPNNQWFVKGILFWVFLIIQIIVYPILALFVERLLWGTISSDRHLTKESDTAVELKNFTKIYKPNFIQAIFTKYIRRSPTTPVVAVDELSLKVAKGQIHVLLGANGSGKSTTLDAVAGLSKFNGGSISLDFSNGLGLCPQVNVHWKDLTVYEHVMIFNRLKSLGKPSSKDDLLKLIDDCDLGKKIHSKAGSLSGGQMRKAQLAVMFTGGSRICLVDECSSGIDPIARRKIQTILLEERSRSNRTIIFTSHYLDEADIADYILIMSKGKLKLQGTAPEIKRTGHYRVLLDSNNQGGEPSNSKVGRGKALQEVHSLSSPAEVSEMLAKLESDGNSNYRVSGPTIEDAFMKVAEEMVASPEDASEERPDSSSDENSQGKELQLDKGRQIGPWKQGIVLVRKRYRVFLRNIWPNLIVILGIPIAAGLTMLFLSGFARAGCLPADRVQTSDISSLAVNFERRLDVVVGPSNIVNDTTFQLLLSTLQPDNGTSSNNSINGLSSNITSLNFTALSTGLHKVDTIDEFSDYINQNYHHVTPGGIFLGNADSPPAFAYQASRALFYPIFIQNMLNVVQLGMPIKTQYQAFDIPWQADQGDSLQFAVYFGLVLSVYPAFFALYPTFERLRKVRSLHYSNGVRALPLWFSYLAFDFAFIIIGSSIAVAALAGGFSPVFFGLGQLWVVLLVYGICATLLAYVFSLYAKSQLAAFAIAAAYGAVSTVVWLVAYLSTLTYASTVKLDQYLNVVHFTLALIFPTSSLIKSLFVSVNILSVNCRGSSDYVSSPGDITAYGGPIVYLIVQSFLLFAFLVWWESGNKFYFFSRRKYRASDNEEKDALEEEVTEELQRIESSTDDGLRVLHMTKAYGQNLAVDDVNLGVHRGEVFGLLGPNGAGKSTMISVIRGDTPPTGSDGDVFIENISLRKHKASARQHLSACPQHDAMDRLTVTEHLKFYARVRGVENVDSNVEEVIRAVGLQKFTDRMADALSGGNKRKLSLGIALMGNPTVMLLDEPSSGLDVAAKRVMWRTIEAVVPGRSIVLTTHSMEEADHLCNRAGILSRRMLAVGTTNYLREKHGNRYHVHILLKSAPYSSTEEIEKVTRWITENFPGAEVDPKAFHGQIRFSVPASMGLSTSREKAEGYKEQTTGRGIASLFSALEANKERLGFDYYSVSQTTLDQVFLTIVGKHNVQEENSGTEKQAKKRWGIFSKRKG